MYKCKTTMKTYVITLSQHFPATHPRKGQPTGFAAPLTALGDGTTREQACVLRFVTK